MGAGKNIEPGNGMKLTGQQIIDAASTYPPMIVGNCYDSAEILAGVYSELRIVEGARAAIWPGISAPRTIEHGWCVDADGTVIDAVFTAEVEKDAELDLDAVSVTYTETRATDVTHSRIAGKLRDEVRRRAASTRPALRTKNLRWAFAEEQRDLFLKATREAAVKSKGGS
jgi:hypothetical protein